MELATDQLIHRAVESTGLDDFGGMAWRPRLERLVASLNLRPFPEDKAAEVANALVYGLSARLRIEDWIARHPEVLDETVRDPLIIMGLPRTGSTALQNNLAADPFWRFMRGWEAGMPVLPPPVAEEEPADPRFLAEKAYIETDTTFKGLDIQEVGGPVEDSLLQRLNWGGPEQGFPAYEYSEWWRGLDPAETLAYQVRAMKLLQSRRPPDRWLLKSPWYVFYLDKLIEAFPGVRLVMTHRDPVSVLPSVASLIYTRYRQFLPASAIDKHQLGRIVLEHWATGISRAMRFREERPDVAIFDIHHRAFNADPIGTLRSLYAWMGETLTAQAEARMADWAARNRRGTHGQHRYTLEEYGLRKDEIEAVFADYIARYLS